MKRSFRNSLKVIRIDKHPRKTGRQNGRNVVVIKRKIYSPYINNLSHHNSSSQKLRQHCCKMNIYEYQPEFELKTPSFVFCTDNHIFLSFALTNRRKGNLKCSTVCYDSNEVHFCKRIIVLMRHD